MSSNKTNKHSKKHQKAPKTKSNQIIKSNLPLQSPKIEKIQNQEMLPVNMNYQPNNSMKGK